MIKKLLYLCAFLLGVSMFQSKLPKILDDSFFCDTLAPTGVNVTNITTTSAVVHWILDPNTADYVVRFRPVGNFPWSSISSPNSTGLVSLTGLMSCTSYEVQVSKTCISQGTWSGIVTFTTLSVNNCTSASTETNLMHISNVTFTPSPASGFPQMVSNSLTSAYTDYRADPTKAVHLVWGSTINVLSVTKSGAVNPATAYITAWVDFNANGIFESSEMVMNSTSNMNLVNTSAFNLPTIASIGIINCSVTMRVIFSNTYVTNGCGNFGYGEVEDYGVYFSSAPNLSVSEITKNKEVSIYPIPAADIMTISGILSDVNFEIYSASGQIVKVGKTSDYQIKVHDLIKGVYLVKIKYDNKINHLKLIKK